MKRYVYGITTIIIVITALFVWKSGSKRIPQPDSVNQPSPTSIPVPIPAHSISFAGNQYAYDTVEAKSTGVSLIENYAAKREFTEILKSASCSAGTNAGFYDESNRPLGLVVTGGTIVHPAISSDLLNGFFFIMKNGDAGISSRPPEQSDLALQSGPILIQNDNALPLQINNDEFARRAAIGILTNKNVLLMVIYNPISVFEGPKLSDLPAIISLIANKESVTLSSAINLDGGTASAFQSRGVTFSELKPVGAVICVR